MVLTDLSSYKSIYLQTAKEYVVNMSSGYSKLVVNSLDNEAISVIHIGSHSLKSQSQVMGFTKIAELSENIEKFSNEILTKSCIVDEKFLSFLKNTIDQLNLEVSIIERSR